MLKILLGILTIGSLLNGDVGMEITSESGLKYVDETIGKGDFPKKGDIVVVHYTGTLEDGTKFDSSVDRNQPIEFPIGMGRVIKGWDEGLSTMKIGGKRKLIIPPNLGYGSRGAGGVIPPDAPPAFRCHPADIHEGADGNGAADVPGRKPMPVEAGLIGGQKCAQVSAG